MKPVYELTAFHSRVQVESTSLPSLFRVDVAKIVLWSTKFTHSECSSLPGPKTLEARYVQQSPGSTQGLRAAGSLCAAAGRSRRFACAVAVSSGLGAAGATLGS